LLLENQTKQNQNDKSRYTFLERRHPSGFHGT
jgi:hypothetical protein